MLEGYWAKHPALHELVHILREGEWVSHVFEWVFMMVSRFAGYLMTLAVGYLIFYAIETKHSMDAIPLHPGLSDQIAMFSNVIINVAPELVFPGVVVLCIRAFTVRRWLDGAAYLVTTIAFVVLTMVLLNAFMNNGITKDFLASMLFWRAGAALFYTVVVAYCSGHGGLDFKTLLNELDALRGELDGGQQTVSSLREELSTLRQRALALEDQVNTGQREASRLQRDLAAEQKRATTLQAQLETGEGDVGKLRRDLNASLVEAETLRTQVEIKQRELASLREMLEGGQEFQESRVRAVLETEQQRVATLQQQLTSEQAQMVELRKQVNTAAIELDRLHQQLDVKQEEVEQSQRRLSVAQTTFQQQLDVKQHEVERIQQALNTEQHAVSTLRQKLDTIQASTVQVSSVQRKGKAVDGGQGKVVQLDASRTRKIGQDESALAEQIRVLIENEPGISGRKIAERLVCSPTTASKWMKFFDEGGQLSVNG